MAARPQSQPRGGRPGPAGTPAVAGDPEFGDPLSTAGDGGPRAAARAADRLLGDRDAVSREVSLGVLQVWQALTEGVSRRPANPEVTLVFTDLVGFSTWSLRAGDDAALALLRQVARALEPPLLDAGGHIVKRMGDGLMAVFGDPTVAVRAVLAAKEAVGSVEVEGYTPRMRVGIHTGRPQRLASDWLGVDVNIAARVMERPPKVESWCRVQRWISYRKASWTRWASRPRGPANRFSGPSPPACPPIWRYIASRLLGSCQALMTQPKQNRSHNECQ